MREYVAETKRRWLAAGALDETQERWLLRTGLLIDRFDPFVEKTPRTIQDITFPETIWDEEWQTISDFIDNELRK